MLVVLAMVSLGACTKQAPPAQSADDDEAAPVAAGSEAPPVVVDRSEKAAGLLQLIDAAPQCQPFRAQLEEAGRTPADQPLPVDMNQVVASAHDAGCTRKP